MVGTVCNGKGKGAWWQWPDFYSLSPGLLVLLVPVAEGGLPHHPVPALGEGLPEESH